MTDHHASKHRATAPQPTTARPASAGSHRAPSATDLPIAAALAIVLLLFVAIMAVRG